MAAATDWLEKDFYAALGVPETASDAEIRKAYRKLARTAHPDANPGDAGAEARFKDISAAYEVVGDPEKRQEYDELRRLASQAPFGRGSNGNFRVRVNNVDDLGGFGGGSGFENLFADFFGEASTGHTTRRRRPRARAGQDLSATLKLPFVDAVYGTSTNVELVSEAVCNDCNGTGERLGESCVTCRGRGRVMRPRSIKVRIPAGVDDGQTIRLPARGAPGHDGGPPGDLYVTVDVDPHPEFGRIGNNLTLTVPVTYPEAVLGADVTVPTLDGSTVKVRVPPGTPPGRTLRVAGKGIPTTDKPGDLLLTIDIDVPTHVSKAERDLVEKLADASKSRRPRARWETTP